MTSAHQARGSVSRSATLVPIVAGAYALFLGMWGAGQALSHALGSNGRLLSLLFFLIVCVAGTGVAVPLWLAAHYRLRLHAPLSRSQATFGMVMLAVGVAFGTLNPDALPAIIDDPPAAASVLKYLAIFVPMGLGITLQVFLLVPRAAESALGSGIWAKVVAVAAAAWALGLGFLIDSRFGNVELAATMTFLGAFLGAGAVLTRSIPAVYVALLLVLMVNTLPERKYVDDPWLALGIGLATTVLATVPFLARSPWLLRSGDRSEGGAVARRKPVR